MHANEALLRKIDEAMAAEDMDTFFGSYTDDVVVHVGGTSSLAGVYKGKDQLQQLFGRFMAAAGEFTFEPHAYLANDEHGVTLQRSHYNKGGRILDSDDAFVCHFRDGKVSEFWLTSQDQAAVDALLG